MRCYPVFLLIYLLLSLGDLLLLVIKNSLIILFPMCLSTSLSPDANINNYSTALSTRTPYETDENLNVPFGSSFRCSTKPTSYIILTIHCLLLLLEVVVVMTAFFSTFWMENLQFNEILRLLACNIPFWLSHVLLTIGIFLYGLLVMQTSDQPYTCNSNSLCPPTLSWRIYTAYGVLQLIDVVMWILNLFFSVFIFGILSTKTLYAPFTVGWDRKESSFNSENRI